MDMILEIDQTAGTEVIEVVEMRELSALQLACAAGGCGEVIFG
jgi:hypothetical protein